MRSRVIVACRQQADGCPRDIAEGGQKEVIRRRAEGLEVACPLLFLFGKPLLFSYK